MGREFLPNIQGLPVYKPLLMGLAAYDMNTGEKLWDIPVGETPPNIADNPLLEGVETPQTGDTGDGHGRPAHASRQRPPQPTRPTRGTPVALSWRLQFRSRLPLQSSTARPETR